MTRRPATAPLALLLATALLAGCASTSKPVVGPPYAAPPVQQPIYLERVVNGSIYQANMATASLFSNDRRPRAIGDTLKINIAENLSLTRKVDTDIKRANTMATQGPGGSGSGAGIIDRLLNLNASASGSDSLKGGGTTDHSTSFTGQIAVSVINVLPNGNLVVAGERGITFNGSNGVLRVAGIVNPQDLQTGNVIGSADMVNARFEVAGEGELQDSAQRSWVQRLLTNQMAIW